MLVLLVELLEVYPGLNNNLINQIFFIFFIEELKKEITLEYGAIVKLIKKIYTYHLYILSFSSNKYIYQRQRYEVRWAVFLSWGNWKVLQLEYMRFGFG